MKKLLKDMQECMERIENNPSFVKLIKDVLDEESTTLYPENDEDSVSVSAIHEDDFNSTAEKITKSILDFVNQNYEWKGVRK